MLFEKGGIGLRQRHTICIEWCGGQTNQSIINRSRGVLYITIDKQQTTTTVRTYLVERNKKIKEKSHWELKIMVLWENKIANSNIMQYNINQSESMGGGGWWCSQRIKGTVRVDSSGKQITLTVWFVSVLPVVLLMLVAVVVAIVEIP